jgi:hypothetical protein
MDLKELRAAHPGWTIERAGRDLLCRRGAWRVRAEDADDAHHEIGRREKLLTVEELGRIIAGGEP